MTQELTHWAIYKNPSDYPGKVVTRIWKIADGRARPDPAAFVHQTVEEARNALPPGLTRIDRSPDDDPCILEVWI